MLHCVLMHFTNFKFWKFNKENPAGFVRFCVILYVSLVWTHHALKTRIGTQLVCEVSFQNGEQWKWHDVSVNFKRLTVSRKHLGNDLGIWNSSAPEKIWHRDTQEKSWLTRLTNEVVTNLRPARGFQRVGVKVQVFIGLQLFLVSLLGQIH